MSLIFVIGLPASGKTTLATQYPDYILIDDPKRKPVIDVNNNYIICDPHLCKPDVFDVVRKLYPDGYYIFFSNNPNQCCVNLSNRNDGRKITEDYINKLSLLYQPELWASLVINSKVIEVYCG